MTYRLTGDDPDAEYPDDMEGDDSLYYSWGGSLDEREPDYEPFPQDVEPYDPFQ